MTRTPVALQPHSSRRNRARKSLRGASIGERMKGKLTSSFAVPRPLKPVGDFLRRVLRRSDHRADSPLPVAPPGPRNRENGSDTERRLNFMLESVPVNLWSTDARLNITFSQGAGLNLIGTSGSGPV